VLGERISLRHKLLVLAAVKQIQREVPQEGEAVN
jgi:hypothetical protein